MRSHGALVIHTVETNSQLILQLVKNNNVSTGEWYKTKAAYFSCLEFLLACFFSQTMFANEQRKGT